MVYQHQKQDLLRMFQIKINLPYILFAFLAILLPDLSNAAHDSNAEWFEPFTPIVGTTEGEFKVSSNGAANYTIPIKVADGIAGMQPNLALKYNSNIGNGILGVGWQLAGLSSIKRCRPNIAQDGVIDNIDYDENDRFCLDGKRLIEVDGEAKNLANICNTGDPVYSASITAEYKTEIESYLRIVACGTQGNGPKYFRIWSKDGRIMNYGTSNNSSVESNVRFGKVQVDEVTEEDSILVWGIQKVTDVKGNYYTVGYHLSVIQDDNSYATPTINYWPTNVIYTGNDNGLRPNRSIAFGYSNRVVSIHNSPNPTFESDENLFHYVGGSKFSTAKRLISIRTNTRHYRIKYKQSETTRRSLVEAVAECNTTNDKCFPPTTFEWQMPTVGFDLAKEVGPLILAPWTSGLEDVKAGDFNGDGKQDIIYTGLDEGGTNNRTYLVRFGQDDHTFGPAIATVSPFLGSAYQDRSLSDIYIFDYDNDGKDEILFFKVVRAANNFEVEAYCGQPTGWADIPPEWRMLKFEDGQFTNSVIVRSADVTQVYDTNYDAQLVSGSPEHEYACKGINSSPTIADINGDGYDDVVYVDLKGYVVVMTNGENGFEENSPTKLQYTTVPGDTPSYIQGKPSDNKIHYSTPMDFNGDGRTDLMVRSTSNTACDFYLSQSNKDIPFLKVLHSPSNCTDTLPLDINGDGITDWLAAGTHLLLSASVGLDSEGLISLPTDFTQIPHNKKKIIDYNADGRQDILVTSGTTGWKIYESTGKGFELKIAMFGNSGSTDLTREDVIVLDINGDGFQDVLTQENSSWKVYPNLLGETTDAFDKISGITDGNYAQTHITYKNNVDESVYTNPTSTGDYFAPPTKPIVDYRIPAQVVSHTDTPLASTDYYYFGARFDRLRKINLGYGKFISHNLDSSKVIDTYNYQLFPLAGRMKSQSTYTLGAPGNFLSTRNLLSEIKSPFNFVTKTGINPQQYFIAYPTGDHIVEKYNGDGDWVNTLLSQRKKTYGINATTGIPTDIYGNISNYTTITQTRWTSSFQDTHTEVINFKYPETSQIINGKMWLTGLLAEKTVAITDKNNATPQIIKTTYGYETTASMPNYGFRKHEIMQPDDDVLKITTEYGYDANYGMPLTNKVTAFDGDYNSTGGVTGGATTSSRIAKTEFINGSINATIQELKITQNTALSNIRQIHSINAFAGTLKSVQDENDLVTSYEYDDFGRITRETLPNYSYTQTERLETCAGADGITEFCSPDFYYVIKSTVFDANNNALPSVLTVFDTNNRERVVRTTNMDGSYVCKSKIYYNSGKMRGLLHKETRNYDCNDATDATAIIAAENSALASVFSYDNLERITKIISPDLTETTYDYFSTSGSSDGIKVRETRQRKGVNPAKSIIKETYTNIMGWVTKTVEFGDDGNIVNIYKYDALGNLKEVIVANDTDYQVSMEYDIYGRQKKLIDPNLGTWLYRYNGFGEMVWQKDANSMITSFDYDGLGRLTKQDYLNAGESIPILTENWQYDLAGTNQIGRLSKMYNDDYSESYTYNANGLLESITKTIDQDYTTSLSYDDFGRINRTTYPAMGSTGALHVINEFNNGYIDTVCINSSATITCGTSSDPIWSASAYNIDGQVTEETRGVVSTNFDYDPATGLLKSIKSNLQDLTFEFDSLGNLESKTDDFLIWLETPSKTGKKRGYVYDKLNRLTTVTYNANPFRSYVFDKVGNIKSRKDWGADYRHYAYNKTSHPNAVMTASSVPLGTASGQQTSGDANGDGVITGVDIRYAANKIVGITTTVPGNANCDGTGAVDVKDVVCIQNKVETANPSDDLAGAIYTYDENGNMTYGEGKYFDAAGNAKFAGRHIAYTPFNKPNRIERENTVVTFDYGPEHSRYRKTTSKNDLTETTIYVDKLFEKLTTPEGEVVYKNYVFVGDETVAVVTKDNAGSNTAFLYSDHLGSVEAIADEAGVVQERFAYDPFGNRIEAAWDVNKDTVADSVGADLTKTEFASRSYTQHEYLDDLGLVHMNGRVYDPDAGRFLSADPFVQFPFSSQGWNRYAYVNNNPLSFMDPSGYFIQCNPETGDCIEDENTEGPADLRNDPNQYESIEVNNSGVVQTGFYGDDSIYTFDEFEKESYRVCDGSCGPRRTSGETITEIANLVAPDTIDTVINGNYVAAVFFATVEGFGGWFKQGGKWVLGKVGSRVRTVNGQVPINSGKYAGKTVPLVDLPREIRNKYPHSVSFSGAGFPDFSRYSIRNVRIELGSTRGVDFRRADSAAGFNRSNPRPAGYTWHHHQDSGYMQLIPTDLHNTIRHTGGIATAP